MLVLPCSLLVGRRLTFLKPPGSDKKILDINTMELCFSYAEKYVGSKIILRGSCHEEKKMEIRDGRQQVYI
jgi:hypothetical protein